MDRQFFMSGRRSVVLDDITTLALQSALHGLGVQQQVTANNIANLETPGFTAQNVSFESSLASAIAAGNPSSATVTLDPTTDAPGVNGNNVSLDEELVTTTKNQLQEQLVSGAITSTYGLMATVLQQG
jgi:flagellar basal-body rod protein FlgB